MIGMCFRRRKWDGLVPWGSAETHDHDRGLGGLEKQIYLLAVLERGV